MDPTKTRIWNADQLGLPAHRSADQLPAKTAPHAAGDNAHKAQRAASPNAAAPHAHRPASDGHGAVHVADRFSMEAAADGGVSAVHAHRATARDVESASASFARGTLGASATRAFVRPRGDETLPSHRRAPADATRDSGGATSPSGFERRSKSEDIRSPGTAQPRSSAPSVALRSESDVSTSAGSSAPRSGALLRGELDAGALDPQPVRGRRSSSVPPPPPPPRRARASVPSPAPGTLTARWSAHIDARGPLASTRIMPIELLLPNLLLPLPQPTAASPDAIAQPRNRTLKRVAGHVLLATLTLLAVASWKLPLAQYVRARYLPPTAAGRHPANAAPAASDLHPAAGKMNGATQAPLRVADDSQHAESRERQADGREPSLAAHAANVSALPGSRHADGREENRPLRDAAASQVAPQVDGRTLNRAARDSSAAASHDALYADGRELDAARRDGNASVSHDSHALGRETAALQAPDLVGSHEALRANATSLAGNDSPSEAARVREVGSRTERGLRRRGGRDVDGRIVSLQRQAVELVIGGDFAGAEQAYRTLANEHPDADAYREAARILAARRRK